MSFFIESVLLLIEYVARVFYFFYLNIKINTIWVFYHFGLISIDKYFTLATIKKPTIFYNIKSRNIKIYVFNLSMNPPPTRTRINPAIVTNLKQIASSLWTGNFEYDEANGKKLIINWTISKHIYQWPKTYERLVYFGQLISVIRLYAECSFLWKRFVNWNPYFALERIAWS